MSLKKNVVMPITERNNTQHSKSLALVDVAGEGQIQGEFSSSNLHFFRTLDQLN